ncbi:conserved hypothetical protein [Ricinus communis]|uniref:Uncharacterized protein n=1 Tax=Ricinus communis TaxID=3988 RepID=B9SAL0_RICCO|nr:conserved hypothetical protein [Ricinus communis]
MEPYLLSLFINLPTAKDIWIVSLKRFMMEHMIHNIMSYIARQQDQAKWTTSSPVLC